jgi:hypothetical protein
MPGDGPSHTREARGLASEIKFVVDPAMGREIRGWARSHLEADPHGMGPFGDEYQTTTIYFDTPTLDVLNRRGSYGRAKYRVRRYGSGDVVFLERKLRRPRLLVKRRTKVSIGELARLRTTVPSDWDGQWFEKRLDARGLTPVCQLSYRRAARGVLTDGGAARLTLDDTTSAVAADGVMFSEREGVSFLDRQLILELKFRSTLPPVFTRLIEQFRLVPTTASKYRLGMAALGHVGLTAEPEVAGVPNVNA